MKTMSAKKIMRHRIWLAVLSFAGTQCMIQGALHDWWRLIALGLLLTMFAVAILVNMHVIVR